MCTVIYAHDDAIPLVQNAFRHTFARIQSDFGQNSAHRAIAQNGPPRKKVARLFGVSRARPEKKAATPPVFQNWLYLLKHPFS
jgi:hypothetical protein